MPARKRLPVRPRDAHDDPDNDVIGTPLPSRGPAMDRGTPMPGELAEPDPDRIAAIDAEIAERHRPGDRIPPPALRDNTRAMPVGFSRYRDVPGDVDLNEPMRQGDAAIRRGMLSDAAADKAGRDMDDAVARRNKRVGRRP